MSFRRSLYEAVMSMVQAQQESSRKRQRTSQVIDNNVYHRDMQVGPSSESEREIALQEGSLERSEQAFRDFCRNVQEEEERRDQQRRQEEVLSSLRNERAMMEDDDDEEGYRAFADEDSAEIVAIYRAFCIRGLLHERDSQYQEENSAQPAQTWEDFSQSGRASENTGTGSAEALPREDGPSSSSHTHDRVNECDAGSVKSYPKEEKCSLRRSNAIRRCLRSFAEYTRNQETRFVSNGRAKKTDRENPKASVL